MSTLFLIRHGLTALTGTSLYGRTPGIHLDDRGEQQAAHLAERLEPVRITAAYSSPLERCVETIEPAARARKLAVVTRPGLLEMEAGDWTGLSLRRLRRRSAWREIQESPSTFRFPGGESFVEASARGAAEVRAIAARHPRGRVAIATHGDIVRLLVAHFAGAPLDEFQRIVIDTASVSVVVLDGRRSPPRVLAMNDTGGLGRFGPARSSAPWETATEPGKPAKSQDLRG
jgi:probable phosphoglycerate mutase